MMIYLIWGLIAFALSFVLTVVMRRVALLAGIVDKPTSKRKIHTQPVAQLGGVAIYVAFAICLIVILLISDTLTSGQITAQHYVGLLVGGFVLMLGGYLDDRYELPPKFSIIPAILAAAIAVFAGIEIEKLTNPFGGVIFLESWQSDLIVFIWLMVVMYTTKFLDGLDGLATSVTSVGAFMVMLLALTAAYYQPDVALLSAIAIGAFIGFLFWNFHPANIFLGEGGSVFVGYLLGLLAVISGGKLATALLVLGIPLLDAAWVVVRRFRSGGLRQIIVADRKHLHHRLLDRGWSQRRITALYVLLASSFGVSALFLQSREKLVALIILMILMLLLASFLVLRAREEEL